MSGHEAGRPGGLLVAGQARVSWRALTDLSFNNYLRQLSAGPPGWCAPFLGARQGQNPHQPEPIADTTNH